MTVVVCAAPAPFRRPAAEQAAARACSLRARQSRPLPARPSSRHCVTVGSGGRGSACGRAAIAAAAAAAAATTAAAAAAAVATSQQAPAATQARPQRWQVAAATEGSAPARPRSTTASSACRSSRWQLAETAAPVAPQGATVECLARSVGAAATAEEDTTQGRSSILEESRVSERAEYSDGESALSPTLLKFLAAGGCSVATDTSTEEASSLLVAESLISPSLQAFSIADALPGRPEKPQWHPGGEESHLGRENAALRGALSKAVRRLEALEAEREAFLAEGAFDLVNSLCSAAGPAAIATVAGCQAAIVPVGPIGATYAGGTSKHLN